MGPEEVHKDVERTGTPLLWRQVERVWVAQPGEEKALRLYHGIPVPKGPTEKTGRNSLSGSAVKGQGIMAFN